MNKRDKLAYIEYCASISIDQLVGLITGLSTTNSLKERLRIAADVYNIRQVRK